MKRGQILETAHLTIVSSKRAFLAFTDCMSPLTMDIKESVESQNKELLPLGY